MIRTAQHGPTGSVPASIHWTHSGHHNEDLTRRVEPRGAGKRRSQRAERWELRGKLSSGQVGDYQRERSSVTNSRRRQPHRMDPEPAPESPVFVSVKQERIRPDYISHRWAELCDRAGVRRIRLHDARHTAVSLFLDKNVPIHQVSAVLGHATPAVTHQTYSHVIGTVGEPTAVVISSMYDTASDEDPDAAVGLRDTAS